MLLARRERRRAAPIGTEQWLDETGGRLTSLQAVALSSTAIAQLVRERLLRSTGSPIDPADQRQRLKVAHRELSAVLVTEQEQVRAGQGTSLLNHACRTYLIGALLVPQNVWRRVDHEAAVVASLMHDEGLVHPGPAGECFTASSATAAESMLVRRGSPPASVAAARAAVVAHFQPTLPPAHGPESDVIARGASADVMGFGLRRIHPGIAYEVWEQWPDLDFLAVVSRLLRHEVSRAPRTRPGVLARSGMPYLLRRGR